MLIGNNQAQHPHKTVLRPTGVDGRHVLLPIFLPDDGEHISRLVLLSSEVDVSVRVYRECLELHSRAKRKNHPLRDSF